MFSLVNYPDSSIMKNVIHTESYKNITGKKIL